MKTYKIRKNYILGNSILLVFPLLLTLITIFEGNTSTSNEWIGIVFFWLLCVLVTFVPALFSIKVGNSFIETYFLNFRTKRVQVADVEVIEYGNLFRGGLGVGKGLKIWVRNPSGSRSYRSIGEKAYGKEAITHIRKILEPK